MLRILSLSNNKQCRVCYRNLNAKIFKNDTSNTMSHIVFVIAHSCSLTRDNMESVQQKQSITILIEHNSRPLKMEKNKNKNTKGENKIATLQKRRQGVFVLVGPTSYALRRVATQSEPNARTLAHTLRGTQIQQVNNKILSPAKNYLFLMISFAILLKATLIVGHLIFNISMTIIEHKQVF